VGGLHFLNSIKTLNPALPWRILMNVIQTYPLHVAAKAARFKPRELRRQVNNGFIALQGCDRASTGSGVHAGSSRRRILQAATTKWLTDLGVSISTASAAARKFSDEGQTGRAPGELFEHGKTALILTPQGATVKNIFSDTSFSDVSSCSACVITLNRVVEQVDTVLK
jgi:hypothetical protein